MPEAKGQSNIKVGSNGSGVVLDVAGPRGHRVIAELGQKQVSALIGGLLRAVELTTFPEGPGQRAVYEAPTSQALGPFAVEGMPGYVENEGP